jgi:threonine/homoserine/homoserine lactone efflux protein
MGEVTRLTTIHDGPAPDGAFLQIVEPGWPVILLALQSLLETGEPLSYQAGVRRRMERLTGLVMIGFGLRLAFERR